MPIIPEFLYDINHPDAPIEGPPRITTTPTSRVAPCYCEQSRNMNNASTTFEPTAEECK